MRFLFVPHSVPGHVRPMLPVAAALTARGAEVRMLAGARFAAAVAATGAGFVPVTTVPDVYVPELLSRRYLAARVRRPLLDRRAAAQLADDLLAHRPDLVVLDPMLAWADRTVRRLGVPSALLSTTIAATGAALAGASRVLRSPVVHGLRPMARRVSRPGRLVLANAVPGLQSDFDPAVRLVGPLLHPPERTWPAPAGRRLLLVSPGTVFARGRRFFRVIADALADRPWTVLMATAHLDPATLGPLPPNVTAARSLPQRAILSRADAFLTHGGMNSTMESVSAGVPMIFAPRSAEQSFIARHCVERGVGVPMPDPRDLAVTVDTLAADEAIRERLDTWKSQLTGTGGAGHAADLLEKAAASLGRLSI